MATTTNYGWTTPDDTALVKDGAAAIRTLGTSIDTTTYNNSLLPIVKTIVDAKGDIIAATAADTVSRLAVGANNTVLTADSSTATGLKWATPAAPSFIGVKLKDTTPQSIANTTQVILTFNDEVFDTNGFHDNATNNSRITIPTGYAGYYRITCNAAYAANGTGIRYIIVYKNGSSFQEFSQKGEAEDVNCTYTFVANLAVADYIQFNCFQNSGGSLNINKNNLGVFELEYLGA
jgi:hypothetical protein